MGCRAPSSDRGVPAWKRSSCMSAAGTSAAGARAAKTRSRRSAPRHQRSGRQYPAPVRRAPMRPPAPVNRHRLQSA
eukprot:15480362-Alexandrium_andersonii.AAC.1